VASRYDHAYMLDPSVLLTEAGLSWLEEEAAAHSEVVISEAFVNGLRSRLDRIFFPFLADDQQENYALYRERALSVLEASEIERFTFQSAGLTDERGAVQSAILASDDPDALVLADEWAFLQSRSWMLAATRAALVAFQRRGASILQFGGRWNRKVAAMVVSEEKIPPRFTASFVARVGVKYVIWGAGTVGGAVGATVGGTFAGGPVGAVAGGAAGSLAGGALTQAGLIAFDP